MRPARFIGLVIPAALAAVACSNATDQVIGGEPLPVIANVVECSTTGAPCSTWTYLYNCYFGPVGLGGCSAQSGCHATIDSTGVSFSGFVCGPTPDSCFQGMKTSAVPGLPNLAPSGITDFTKTALYAAIHKTGTARVTANNMPLVNAANPTIAAYAFTPADLACIAGWVKAGAPQN